VDAWEADIANHALRVDTSFERAETPGDRFLLERLVANLVDNAVRHNHPDGWIRLSTGIDGDHAFVRIANSGAAVPDEEVPSMFEPFRRMEERTNAHEGVGLGLAIVKSISVAHGGRVEAHSQSEGGLLITVLLPRAATPTPSDDRPRGGAPTEAASSGRDVSERATTRS
jgi:signal transduction histidine kinase